MPYVYANSNELVPESARPIRSGHQAEGTDPFAEYDRHGREVVDSLPETATEGDTYTLNWAGGSGWYQTGYRYTDGQWVEEGSNAPWQMSI